MGPSRKAVLLARYAAGERYFQHASLGGAELQGADLRGANFEDADLEDAQLQGAGSSRGKSQAGAKPLATSTSATGSAAFQPITRRTLVAPRLPLPLWRRSTP